MHKKRHTGERPFVCPFCAYAFTQKCNLKTHILRAHEDQAQQLLEYTENAEGGATPVAVGEEGKGKVVTAEVDPNRDILEAIDPSKITS